MTVLETSTDRCSILDTSTHFSGVTFRPVHRRVQFRFAVLFPVHSAPETGAHDVLQERGHRREHTEERTERTAACHSALTLVLGNPPLCIHVALCIAYTQYCTVHTILMHTLGNEITSNRRFSWVTELKPKPILCLCQLTLLLKWSATCLLPQGVTVLWIISLLCTAYNPLQSILASSSGCLVGGNAFNSIDSLTVYTF